jgi:hypothetical protein
MSIIVTSVSLLAACVLVYLLLKARPKSIRAIFFWTWLFLVFVAFLFIYKKAVISRRENSVGTVYYCRVPQAVGEEDQKFLNDLLEQQSQTDQRKAHLGLDQNMASAESDLKTVRRAELIVNTSEVRRAQLVVNNRVLERGELVRRKYQ